MTPIAYSVADAAAICGVSESTIKRAIHAVDGNPLKAKRTGGGGKYLILHADLVRWAEGLADA